MGPKPLSKCHIALAGSYKEPSTQQVISWINNAGGHAQSSKVNANTTHLVATKKAWDRHDAIIQQVLKMNANGHDIKIVSLDWLEDSTSNKTKKKEGPYLWEKLGAATKKTEKKAAKDAAKVGGATSHVGMMAEVFQESTDRFVDEAEKKRIDREIAQEERIKKAMENEERAEKEKKQDEERQKKAILFAHGAKKARNELFTENYHLFTDNTNFRYDVSLTKVDTRLNRNERYALTIYESNSEPHTYAMNCQFAGTGKLPSNNILAAMGCNYHTAFRAFTKVFKEKTGVKWDDRISYALARAKREKRDRGLGTGSEAGTVRGVPISESRGGVGVGKSVEKDFASLPFEYHPPRFGARGHLPKEKMQEIIDMDVEQGNGSGEGSQRVECWMSGADGAGEVQHSAETPLQQPLADDAVDGAGAEQMNTVETNHQQDVGVQDLNTLLDFPHDHAERTIHNKDINELMDSTFPFEPSLENFDFENYMNEADTPAAIDNDITQQDAQSTNTVMTFDQADQNTAHDSLGLDFQVSGTRNPDSFDGRPSTVQESEALQLGSQDPSLDRPSTVQESFQPGTQEIGETQIAEKAQGEFEEFVDQHQQVPSKALLHGFDLGSSILGKRKDTAAIAQSTGPEKKKQKSEDGLGQVEGMLGYGLGSVDQGGDGGFGDGEAGIPRVMVDEENAIAGGDDEGVMTNGGIMAVDEEDGGVEVAAV